MELELKRACYGKDDTLMDNREYSLFNGGPVGTRKEIQEFYKGKGYTKVILLNKTGEITDQVIEY